MLQLACAVRPLFTIQFEIVSYRNWFLHFKMHKITLLLIDLWISGVFCETQMGPEPWNYESSQISDKILKDDDIPFDLKFSPRTRLATTSSSVGLGEWFFRRILGILLKGGQVKKKEDGDFEINLHMKLNDAQYNMLDEYIRSNEPLNENKFRRAMGYVEDAIYKPTIVEEIYLAWSDYVQIYLMEYKSYITWTLAAVSSVGLLMWLWSRMSQRHIFVLIICLLYLFEVFVSYKEAEQKEIDNFMSALNNCKWRFWSSTCVVPSPDPLALIRHMNPLKIGIRMFTAFISEPMVALSSSMKILIQGITDDLWFPLNSIVYGFLLVIFNILLIFLIVSLSIMIFFNFILNVPFHLSFFAGLLNIGVNQRQRNVSDNNVRPNENIENSDRISGATLHKMLDVVSQALSNNKHVQNVRINSRLQLKDSRKVKIPRSSSTGRLPDMSSDSFDNNCVAKSVFNVRRRLNGSGDAP